MRWLNGFEGLADLFECSHAPIDVVECVRSGDLHANASFAFWHNWIAESDHVYAFVFNNTNNIINEIKVRENSDKSNLLSIRSANCEASLASPNITGLMAWFSPLR